MFEYIAFDTMVSAVFGRSVSSRCTTQIFDVFDTDEKDAMEKMLADTANKLILALKKYNGRICRSSSTTDGHELLDFEDKTNEHGWLLSLLRINYHIRCNMFHGAKLYDEIQKNIITYSGTTMQLVNDYLLEQLDILTKKQTQSNSN